MQVSLLQGTKHLPRLFGLVLAVAAAWPGVAAADADGLDATLCTFDPGSDARESDSAFAESAGDTNDAWTNPPTNTCGTGPECSFCEHCVGDSCVALPVACTKDSDCGEFKFCKINAGAPCVNSCEFKPGKCNKAGDCGPFCYACQANSCIEQVTGNCGPKAPCPAGYVCHWDEWACTRTCTTPTGGSGPDASGTSDLADTAPDTAADTQKPSDGFNTLDTAGSSDSAKLDASPPSDSSIAPLDAAADSAGAPVPPMAPADPGCSAGPSGGAAPWSLWLALAVLVLVRGRRKGVQTLG